MSELLHCSRRKGRLAKSVSLSYHPAPFVNGVRPKQRFSNLGLYPVATDSYAQAAPLNHTLTTAPTSTAARVRRAVGDARNWLLLATVLLSAVAGVSLLLAHGMGARWTGWLSIVLLGSIACDARVRAVMARAWSEVCLLGIDRSVLPWRTAILLIALPNLLLLLCHAPGIQTGDSRPVAMTAASLLTDGDAELSEFAEFYRRNRFVPEGQDLPYFLVRCPAGVFSQYPSGMLPFALPVVAAARLLHPDFTAPIVDQHLEQLTAALVAAACTTLFFLLAWQVASPATALLATVMLGTGSVMYSTVGQALWPPSRCFPGWCSIGRSTTT
ncbi:MAG TPA: hypothetical protein VFI31_29555 [Pirellulales bacterium]|nr:hypothetical protein [Pirellulales bacterium]